MVILSIPPESTIGCSAVIGVHARCVVLVRDARGAATGDAGEPPGVIDDGCEGNAIMTRSMVAALALGCLAVSGAGSAAAARQPAQYTVSLRSMDHAHAVGTALVAYNSTARHTTVTLHLRGLSAGIHFAHIHVGRCGGNGDVKYPLAPMQAGRAGTATSVTVLPGHLSGSALHINVHGVPGQALLVVACGNL